MALFEVPKSEEPDGSELPALRGSEKQIEWAAKIRPKLLAQVSRYLRERRELLQRQPEGPKKAQLRAGYTRLVDAAGRIERREWSSWWIERRDNSADELLTDKPARPGDGR